MDKICNKCKQVLDSSLFRKHRGVCRPCDSKEALARFNLIKDLPGVAEHRALAAKIRRRRKPEFFLFMAAKTRAKKYGWAFNLDPSDIVIPKLCPVLGLSLGVQDKQSANSPTLDRFDNSKGYVKGNVRVISWRANALKSDATVEELERVVEYMKTIC